MHSYKQSVLAINANNQKATQKPNTKGVVMKEILKTKVKIYKTSSQQPKVVFPTNNLFFNSNKITTKKKLTKVF